MTDPVQEAQDWPPRLAFTDDGVAKLFLLRYPVDQEAEALADLNAILATIRREEARSVLRVLRAWEWAGAFRSCAFSCGGDEALGHNVGCPLTAEINRLEALVGRLCPRCGGAGTTIEGSSVSAQWPEPCPECGDTGSVEALVRRGGVTESTADGYRVTPPDPVAEQDAAYTDGYRAGRESLLSSIPAEAREVIAAWLEAEYDHIADDSRRYADLSAITDEAKDKVWGTLAHQYLRPLAAALQGGGEYGRE